MKIKALDARRKELEELHAQLETADEPPPLLHPEMGDLYRQKVRGSQPAEFGVLVERCII